MFERQFRNFLPSLDGQQNGYIEHQNQKNYVCDERQGIDICLKGRVAESVHVKKDNNDEKKI